MLLWLQLQLKQYDGAPPLSADIQSTPVNARVQYYRSRGVSVTSITRTLPVPASGILVLTLPVNADTNSISIAVVFHFSDFSCSCICLSRVSFCAAIHRPQCASCLSSHLFSYGLQTQKPKLVWTFPKAKVTGVSFFSSNNEMSGLG